MRSVYAKILLWCFGTLALALVAFFLIARFAFFRVVGDQGPFESANAAQVAEAAEAYESGGVPGLVAYLDRLRKYLPGEEYLTDASGRDLVSGRDWSQVLSQAGSEYTVPHHIGSDLYTVRRTADDKYRMIIVSRPKVNFRSFVPDFLLVFVLVAVLCWVLAVNLASPLRQLARTVDRFGRGELSVRMNWRRRDEIGDLARAFDQMAERIETLLGAERRLLQDISHELRSPLSRLAFAAELTKTAEDRSAAAARLQKEIGRLTGLVGALVQVTRMEGDPASANLEDVLLEPLLKELVEDCRVEADAKDCALGLAAEFAGKVRGDRELLRRAIENVLRNAIRYAPDHSPVEIRLSASSASALVAIRDYGPGVPEEALPKIFLPFFRVDGSRDSATGGAGLGLSIAHRAVTLHRGQLRAQNVHRGLEVTIELPLANSGGGN